MSSSHALYSEALVLLGGMVMATLVGCTQANPPPPDAARVQDGGNADLDAGDAGGIPDCAFPCADDRFLGGC